MVRQWIYNINTRSSAIAEGPRDALCQLKYCQLLHSCTKKSHLKRLAVGEWPWRSLKVIGITTTGRLRGTVVLYRSLPGELSLSCARPAADGWPLIWK